jgi:hypothetical protein
VHQVGDKNKSDFIVLIYELNRALSFHFNVLYGKEPLHDKIKKKIGFCKRGYKLRFNV